MRNKYKQEISKGITGSNEQDNQNEETSESKWENINQVVTVVASEVVGYEEMKKRNDWYDEEYKIKMEERNKASVKIQNKKTRLNPENYKYKQREAKKICRGKKRAHALKMLEGMQQANKTK
jgi:hypothetical protein